MSLAPTASLLLKKGAIGKLYTGDMRERETLQNFFLSQRAGEAHCLCSGTIAYIGSGKEIKGNNMEDKGKQMRTKLHIWSID